MNSERKRVTKHQIADELRQRGFPQSRIKKRIDKNNHPSAKSTDPACPTAAQIRRELKKMLSNYKALKNIEALVGADPDALAVNYIDLAKKKRSKNRP